MSPNSTDRQTVGYSGFIGMILILVYFLWKLPTGKNIPVLCKDCAQLLIYTGNFTLKFIFIQTSAYSSHASSAVRFKLRYKNLALTHFVFNLILIFYKVAITMMNRRLLRRSPKSAPYWVVRMMKNKILNSLSSPRRKLLAEIQLKEVGLTNEIYMGEFYEVGLSYHIYLKLILKCLKSISSGFHKVNY